MAVLNRKRVNDRIAEIVNQYEAAIRGDSTLDAIVAVSGMIRDLQAHMDETVEAAYQWGAEAAKEENRYAH